MLEYLPSRYHAIKIPATSSVKRHTDTTGKTLLEFWIDLYGASTKRRDQVLCPGCEKREGKRKGTPRVIDYKTESDGIEPKEGKLRVDFVLCCYPEDHQQGDTDFQ